MRPQRLTPGRPIHPTGSHNGESVEKRTTEKVPLGRRGIAERDQEGFGEGDFNVNLYNIINTESSHFKRARWNSRTKGLLSNHQLPHPAKCIFLLPILDGDNMVMETPGPLTYFPILYAM